MAKNTRLSSAAAIAGCNAEVDLVDAGSGTAVIEFYTGTQPGSPDDAITDQTLVASVDLSSPAFGNATDGSGDYAEAALNGTPLTDSSADNTGVITWYRIKDKDGTAVIDGSAGISSGDFNCLIDNPSVVEGQEIKISSLVHRVPWHS